jgi:hypothetical protein
VSNWFLLLSACPRIQVTSVRHISPHTHKIACPL